MDDDSDACGEESFDFEAEEAVGSSVEILHFITDTWKRATIVEVDIEEQEMLVMFDSGCQEWVNIDRSKIRKLKARSLVEADNSYASPVTTVDLVCNLPSIDTTIPDEVSNVQLPDVTTVDEVGNDDESESLSTNDVKIQDSTNTIQQSASIKEEPEMLNNSVSDKIAQKDTKVVNEDKTDIKTEQSTVLEHVPQKQKQIKLIRMKKHKLDRSKPKNIGIQGISKSLKHVENKIVGKYSPSSLIGEQKHLKMKLKILPNAHNDKISISPETYYNIKKSNNELSCTVPKTKVTALHRMLQTPKQINDILQETESRKTSNYKLEKKSKYKSKPFKDQFDVKVGNESTYTEKHNSSHVSKTESEDSFTINTEKLPSLKIKLTRHKQWDGTSMSKDTFVVTGQTIDGIDQSLNKEANKVSSHKSKKQKKSFRHRGRYTSPESEEDDSDDKNSFCAKKRKMLGNADYDENDDSYIPKAPKIHKPFGAAFNKAEDNTFGGSFSKNWIDVNGKRSDEQKSIVDAVNPPSEQKRIKMLLPRVRPVQPLIGVRASNDTGSSSPSAACRSESGFICPKKDCQKQFRRENLLMMHIKHYHTEYKSLLRTTPNVADLAYARTTGQTITSPQSEFLEKISRIEEGRSKDLDSKSLVSNSPSASDSTASTNKQNTEDVASPDRKSVTSKSSTQSTSDRSKKMFGKTADPTWTPGSSSKMPSLLAQLQEPKLSEKHKGRSTLAKTNSILSSLLRMRPLNSLPRKSTSWSLFHAEQSEQKCVVNSGIDSEPTSSLADKKKKKQVPMATREIVNCVCGYADEDGLMIQCEVCLCWQHGSCNNIEQESDVPPDYVCTICRNPRRQHTSRKYAYSEHWFTEGKLPCFDVCKTDPELHEKREKFLKESHMLLGRLLELKNVLHTLRIKNHILGQTYDHPKLYLWSKPWNEQKLEEERRNLDSKKTQCDGPVPEAAINMKVCRKNLLEHLEEEMITLEDRLLEVESKIDDLDYDIEENDDDVSSNNSRDELDEEKRVKELLHLMASDLNSV